MSIDVHLILNIYRLLIINITHSSIKLKIQAMCKYRMYKEKFPEFTSPLTLLFGVWFFCLYMPTHTYAGIHIY